MKSRKVQESTRGCSASIEHVLMDSDLSGLQADCDVDMNNIMSVLDQKIDKGTHFIIHSPAPSDSVAYHPHSPQFNLVCGPMLCTAVRGLHFLIFLLCIVVDSL